MPNRFVVIFTEDNAIIEKDPERFAQALRYDGSILNPDLSFVKGIPPHFWKQVGNNVFPMTRPEKIKRMKDRGDNLPDYVLQEIEKEDQFLKKLYVPVIIEPLPDVNHELIPDGSFEIKEKIIEKEKINWWMYICLLQTILLFFKLL